MPSQSSAVQSSTKPSRATSLRATLSLLGKKSPLARLEREAIEASKRLEKENAKAPRLQTLPKQPSLNTMIKQGLHGNTPKTPAEETTEKPVYLGVGEYEGADLSRSDAIKRGVARPRATSELHRSNAVHHPTKAASVRNRR